MNDERLQIVFILALSVLVQGAAAMMAIRLMGITGRKMAWSLIALALSLMAVRRIVPLIRLVTGDLSYSPDMMNEIIGLALSVFMAVGISRIAPLFIERIRAEEQLREKTEELNRYFSDALDLLCIADMDGFFRRLNPEWEATLGYPLAELEGRQFIDFVHPDDREATVQAVSQLARQKEVREFANRYRRKDGSYCWIEWRSYRTGARIYAVARDITKRIQAEEDLRQLNQELDRKIKERTAELEAKNRELEQTIKLFVGRELRMIELKEQLKARENQQHSNNAES